MRGAHLAKTVFLVAVALFASAAAQSQSLLSSENVTISPPDVYPPNGTFVGEVEVKIVANQPDANIYWTKNGDTPTNASRLYTGPINLFEPGTWQILAIAIPKVPGALLNSPIKARTYVITPSEVSIPIVSPPRGKYRGMVQVSLSSSEGGTSKIQYVVDVDDPGNTWQTYTGPFLLDTPGEHVVKCRVVVGQGDNVKRSPVARYRFEIKPPLVYDVTSECPKCGGQPTLGKIFTVWLQSAEVGSIMFLTTSSKGCEMNKHMLDDTEYTTIRFRQVAYRFVTYIEAQPKVYVCLQEPSNVNRTFVTVPRRIKAGAQGVSEASFSVEPAFGAVKRQQTEAPQNGPTRQPFSDQPTFSISFIVVFAALVLLMIATCTVMGKMFRTTKYHGHHRVPKASTVSADDV